MVNVAYVPVRAVAFNLLNWVDSVDVGVAVATEKCAVLIFSRAPDNPSDDAAVKFIFLRSGAVKVVFVVGRRKAAEFP